MNCCFFNRSENLKCTYCFYMQKQLVVATHSVCSSLPVLDGRTATSSHITDERHAQRDGKLLNYKIYNCPFLT